MFRRAGTKCVIWLITPSWGRDLQLKLLQGLTDSTNRDMLRYKLQCNQMSSQMTEVLQSKTYIKPGSAWPQFYKHQVVFRQLCTQGMASCRLAVGTGHQPLTQWRAINKAGPVHSWGLWSSVQLRAFQLLSLDRKVKVGKSTFNLTPHKQTRHTKYILCGEFRIKSRKLGWIFFTYTKYVYNSINVSFQLLQNQLL